MNKTTQRRGRSNFMRVGAALTSVLDPRALVHFLRILHYYNYTHVSQVRRLSRGAKVRIAPNTSFANAERIRLNDGVQIGAHCTFWAGDNSGQITVGTDTTFGPECFLTASDYGSEAGKKIIEQEKRERNIVIGSNCWLGARVVVLAGVTIGDGCIVGAGSVVTRDLPPSAIAVGAPAKTIRIRR